MTARTRPSPGEIRRERAENSGMRERDFARHLGISEADFLAAYRGDGVRLIDADVERLFAGVEALGEVMALTRNESAVHEKIGVYDKPVFGRHAAMVLGGEIDLRIFPRTWAHGFAVEKQDGESVRRSLQFFDAAGDAVHRIHLRPASDVAAYERLVDTLLSSDQSRELEMVPRAAEPQSSVAVDLDELRRRWSAMKDVHQFVGILRDLGLTRRRAVELVGSDYAWPLETGAVAAAMHMAADAGMPIMCFVGNRGCIQIHSGPVHRLVAMGPWLNVMDPTFHLHLRVDHTAEAWAVRKPNSEGHVTSIEAYAADGSMIIQFFGKRKEGTDERADWRGLVENLPALRRNAA